MPWYRKLHWQIIIGLVLGLAFGVVAAVNGWNQFTADWVAPFGTIFLNLLKLVAVPLVLASLVAGVTSLSDLQKLSRIGGKTIALYLGTTAIAITVGLVYVNAMRPGGQIPEELRNRLEATYQENVEKGQGLAETAQERGPLQPLVDVVPSNFFNSATDNSNMLQIVFVAIFVGIGLLLIPGKKAEPLIRIFESLNDLVIKLVEIVMLMAPLGVFALLADTITSITAESAGQILELLGALAYYCLAVVLGLATMVFVVYPALLKSFTNMSVGTFFRGIAPAQLVAFSTSSSGATLPVTMDCAEKNLGVSEEVSSFALPLGATINMDGTALYQGVAALFIGQVLNVGLSLGEQIELVTLVVLISIGTAAVPSAGIVMLVIVLENFGIPAAGIALIVGVDRPLDMLRTTNNITGDAMVASAVASSEDELHIPESPQTEGVNVEDGQPEDGQPASRDRAEQVG
jgi:Na+/H+-dicarboxylate symporter